MPKVTKKSPGSLGFRHEGRTFAIHCGTQGVPPLAWETALKNEAIRKRLDTGDLVVEADRIELVTLAEPDVVEPEVPTESDAEAQLPEALTAEGDPNLMPPLSGAVVGEADLDALAEAVVTPIEPEPTNRRRTRHG